MCVQLWAVSCTAVFQYLLLYTNGVYDPFIACGPTVDISDTITAQVYGKQCTCAPGCCHFVQWILPFLHARVPADLSTPTGMCY